MGRRTGRGVRQRKNVGNASRVPHASNCKIELLAVSPQANSECSECSASLQSHLRRSLLFAMIGRIVALN
eukprot:1572817-Pyramimonas_sp.AAC.1